MAGYFKEEVVISGISGMFPESNGVEELKDLLFNKINGITIDSRRWVPNETNITHGTGKMKAVDDFDETFFKTHPKLATVMDLVTRIALERSVEAIIDAGLSPIDLNGTNTAVFMSLAISETELLGMECSRNTGNSMLGRSRTMQANRLSYVLNLTGPSYTTDGGWICCSDNLAKAKTMIENGEITAAIVGATNLCLRPEFQYQFKALDKLNSGTCTKPFSSDADGYNRSEASIVFFLQRASDAKRSYGTLLSVKSVHFGEHDGHITEHEEDHLKSLLLDSYKSANIDPASVEYIEANGSGIKSEDSIELNAMEEVFCTSKRRTPLKVGSVKSNVGHCETSGLFTSLVKAIIALDSGYIPPNINYTDTNKSHPAIKNGKIQIVTEKTRLVDDVIGISTFGFSNAFSHVVLKRNNKVKNIVEIPGSNDILPKLILASGRNEENTKETMSMIVKHGNDAEFLALTYEVFTKNINSHFHRSFSIFPNPKESPIYEVWNVNLQKRPIWFIFSGMGSQWHGMGTYLMKHPIFANAIDRCDAILKPRGVDIKYILTSLDPQLFDNILNSFVGIAAIQIGLVDILKALDIIPDGIIGHSVGELGCAYADGSFTAEEMLLSAYARGRASLETNLIPGMMAAIGLGYHQIKDRIPHDIDIACRNSASSCTISGPKDSINDFVSVLVSEGVFAKAVNVAGIAYHSRYIQAAGPTLLKYLKEVINDPKPRSSKWISSSIPESKWNSDLAKYSSAEYHTNNLLNSVLFEDALKYVPSEAIAIEIAPHGLLQAILKKALPETVSNIPLTKKMYGDSIQFLLNSIGRMYICGMNPKVQGINPKISFPVSRETPSLSKFPLWNHTYQFSQKDVLSSLLNTKSAEKFTQLVLTDESHLIGYQINGQHIIPPSFILISVWKFFVEINSKNLDDEPIKFQNLRFISNIELHSSHPSINYIMIQQGSGLFEYSIDDNLVFSGEINFVNKSVLCTKKNEPIHIDHMSNMSKEHVFKDEIYSLFENNGYCLENNYKNIIKFVTTKKLIHGQVKWKNDWVYFIDGLLKFTILDDLGTHRINAPISIGEITIDPAITKNIPEKDLLVSYNKVTNELNCAGVKILGVENGPLLLSILKSKSVKFEEKKFVQFNQSIWKNINEFIEDSMNLILETDRLNYETANEKLILCTPYHYGDSISKACTESLKQILDNHLSFNYMPMVWDNIENTSSYDESGKFIMVTNVNYLRDTFKVLAKKKCSYIFVSSEQKLSDSKDWKIIIQQKFNNISYLSLIKKDTIFDENSVIVKTTNKSYDQNIWKTLDNYKAETGIIYIISKSEPLEGVHNYVKNMTAKYHTRRLRFIFILDSKAPGMDSDKLFYKNQLIKGFIINIYKNGGWGFYKRIFVGNLEENMKINNSSMLKNLKINSETTFTVKYLGLNYKDLEVDDNNEDKFRQLDYSGLVQNDKQIMGIASFEPKTSKLKYDSFLSWPVPSTWSLEDATTVPLSYAMSYYVFNILSSLQRESSILVTSGLHPIGQAAIAIGLAEKCEMYAVVECSKEAEQLSNIFPELSPSRIIVNKTNKFDVKLMMMTKSKGVNLVLNFLKGEALQAAFRTIAFHGKFFHFSNKKDVKYYEQIGTRIFLRNTSFTFVSTSMLLNESDQNKQIVRLAFMDGLNRGVIKPLPKFDLTSFSKNRSICMLTIRTASTLNTTQKVVLPANDVLSYSKFFADTKNDTYQCHLDQVNVIIANKLEWLDIAEWLVDRKAKRIVIVTKKCLMSSTNCRRFDKLLSRNLSIQFESDIYLKTEDETLNWLNRLTSSDTLGSLFIVNQLDDKKINNLRYAFEKNKNKTETSSFVCMSSNADLACNDLNLIGLKALNISWDETSSHPKTVSRMLFLLDTLLQKANIENSFSFICSEKRENKSEWSQKMNEVIKNHFPNSIDDLYGINEIIRKDPGFVEVQTRSPRFSQLKSVVPVFVIPGFRPKLFETFYKQFLYPVFEARLPEHIDSIDELSRILVDEIKRISNRGSVTLIGESWGGVVALKMAQILEAQDTLVTLSLLNGDPKTVIGWAECFLSKEYYVNKLNTMYNSYSAKLLKCARQSDEEDCTVLRMSTYKKSVDKITEKALNWMSSCLRMLFETRPLPNKLLTKVVIFNYEKMSVQIKTNDLIDYCVNPPCVCIVPGNEYEQMMTDTKMISHLTKIVVYPYTIGNNTSLCDKYKNFYFFNEKLIKNIN